MKERKVSFSFWSTTFSCPHKYFEWLVYLKFGMISWFWQFLSQMGPGNWFGRIIFAILNFSFLYLKFLGVQTAVSLRHEIFRCVTSLGTYYCLHVYYTSMYCTTCWRITIPCSLVSYFFSGGTKLIFVGNVFEILLVVFWRSQNILP